MNVHTARAASKVARPGRRRRWAATLIAVTTVAAGGLLGASSASAAPTPTITAEYDATSTVPSGEVVPSVIFRGSGFHPAAYWDSFKRLHVEPNDDDRKYYWFDDDLDSTLVSSTCTHMVPSHCFITYQAGELRPHRLYLWPTSHSRAPQCGQMLTAYVIDVNAHTMYSNKVTLRVPSCDIDIYTPRRTIPVTP